MIVSVLALVSNTITYPFFISQLEKEILPRFPILFLILTQTNFHVHHPPISRLVQSARF